MPDLDDFDLPAYLARIGSPLIDGANRATLARLHRAHLAAIPFENLDIQMGRAIELDARSLQQALVARRRGGYCFQQNGLFRLALEALGYAPRLREARVRFDSADAAQPRTHMVLVVPVAGVEQLVDVGFGAAGIVEPLDLAAPPTKQDGWTYRMTHDGRLRVLQRAADDGWTDLYAFADDDIPEIDFEVGNWFTSTHPRSRFVKMLTAQRMVGATRHALRDLSYRVASGGGEWQSRTIARADLAPFLLDVFGIDVPHDARFRALDGPRAEPR